MRKKQAFDDQNSSEDTAPLHIKLRPKSFEEVVGQDAVIKSLENILGESPPHAFLFTGPSGVGKTTLARILANRLGCEERNVMEIDAATHSGIDDMRAVVSMMQYQAFGESSVRAVIVDECHALSKQTWQALLKALEEPPAHAYWCLCTTESDKVPKTILTRCHRYDLKPLRSNLLEEYLEVVRDAEELKVGGDVLAYVADRAEGSVRQALVYLSAVRGCSNRKEAHELLAQAMDSPELIDLARRLCDGKGLTWQFACEVLKGMGHPPESARLVIVNYISQVLLGTNDERRATRLLGVLDAFAEPYRQGEKNAPLLLSIGRVLYGGGD